MQQQPSKHPWEARSIVCLIMLLLAFFGIIFTDVRSTGGWTYWRVVVPIYALMALWLSWYLRRKQHSISAVTIWHELLHWLGLIASTFLVSEILQMGIVSRFSAGIIVLALVSQAVFLAGIYIETTFLFIGIVLGVFAWMVAFTVEYLFAFAILTIVLAGAAAGLMIWLKHRKSQAHK